MRKRRQGVRELIARTELVRAHQAREFWEGFWRSVAAIGPAAMKWGCLAWGATKAAQVLVAWTGTQTRADVRLQLLTDVLSEPDVGTLLPWAVVLVIGLLYRREKALKEKALARLGAVTLKYERLSDPNGSSSQLPPTGQTNPGDVP